jgi:hypothetical protein
MPGPGRCPHARSSSSGGPLRHEGKAALVAARSRVKSRYVVDFPAPDSAPCKGTLDAGGCPRRPHLSRISVAVQEDSPGADSRKLFTCSPEVRAVRPDRPEYATFCACVATWNKEAVAGVVEVEGRQPRPNKEENRASRTAPQPAPPGRFGHRRRTPRCDYRVDSRRRDGCRRAEEAAPAEVQAGQIKAEEDGTKYVCNKRGKWIKVLWLQVGGQTVGVLATEGVAS